VQPLYELEKSIGASTGQHGGPFCSPTTDAALVKEWGVCPADIESVAGLFRVSGIETKQME
jgi:hypothetical protein